MSTTAQDSAATRALLERIDQKATGRLTVGADADQLSVYLMGGNVVAAEAPDDQRVLVHLLQRQGVLRRKIVQQMDATLQEGKSVFGDLLQYAGPALDQPLAHRFENNLARFVGARVDPEWEDMRGVFVDNLQMGLDSAATVQQAIDQWDKASSLDIDTVVVSGAVPFEGDNQIWIAKAVGKGERQIAAILHGLPMEEIHAKIEMLDMLAKGMIAVAGIDLDDQDEEPTETRDLDESEDDSADAETVFGIDIAEVQAAVEAAQAEEAEQAQQAEQAEQDGEAGVDTVVDAPPVSLPGQSGTLSEWIDQMSHVDDDELDFFRDHDFDRGSGAQGAFSTESHNLDRVEVVGMDSSLDQAMDELEPDEDEGEDLEEDLEEELEELELAEAPSAKFGAPVLGENEAIEKLMVANDALAHVVSAFDQAEGAGRGRSVIQLLVDGSPAKFATLFTDIQVGEDGVLPQDDVVVNLWTRPPTEHRQLLNNGLVDIIDRALSSAADELPDELFDSMYESIAGYRQRLGL